MLPQAGSAPAPSSVRTSSRSVSGSQKRSHQPVGSGGGQHGAGERISRFNFCDEPQRGCMDCMLRGRQHQRYCRGFVRVSVRRTKRQGSSRSRAAVQPAHAWSYKGANVTVRIVGQGWWRCWMRVWVRVLHMCWRRRLQNPRMGCEKKGEKGKKEKKERKKRSCAVLLIKMLRPYITHI